MKIIILGKSQRGYSTTENSYGSPELCSPSGLLYAIYINKHMHTHTHPPFCISYKSIWFSSSAKSHFTGSTFLQGCFWYLSFGYVCIPEENNLLSRTPSDTGL